MFHDEKIWLAIFEGEGDKIPDKVPDKEPDKVPDKGKFTHEQQEHINKLLNAEKQKGKIAIQTTMDEVNALKKKVQMTDEERSELESRLESVQTQLLTKDEQAKREANKLQKKLETDMKELVDDRDKWKSSYHESTIARSITDASIEHKAYFPEQIISVLKTHHIVSLVESTDEEGKPNGIYEARVKFSDFDDKGKPITLDITVKEAVKRMTEIVKYYNLFEEKGKAGIGLNNRKGSKKPSLVSLASNPKEYRKARKDGTIDFNDR